MLAVEQQTRLLPVSQMIVSVGQSRQLIAAEFFRVLFGQPGRGGIAAIQSVEFLAEIMPSIGRGWAATWTTLPRVTPQHWRLLFSVP
jgi:hypothetical protein